MFYHIGPTCKLQQANLNVGVPVPAKILCITYVSINIHEIGKNTIKIF